MTNLIPSRRRAQQGGQLQPVTRLRSNWDRLFDTMLDDFWPSAASTFGATAQGMALDLTETDDEIVVRAEVPGIDPEDLEIQLNGDVLSISGEKTAEEEHKEGARHYSERVYGSYQRTIQLPKAVDPERVKAESKHGVVTITLRKAEVARSRKIDVKST